MASAWPLLALLAGCLPVAESSAAEQTFSSGPIQVHLIELYTSQGCSSCPPADHWLRQWTARAELWQRVVPLALHVDYWDYLGWKDPFASPDHSARQRRYHREGALRAVYTPGFLKDGREWRQWSGTRPPELRRGEPVGDLVVRVNGERASARFTPAAAGLRPARVYLVLLGFGLRTEIGAGENRGRTLRHDFVVLGLTERALVARDGAFEARLALPRARRPAPRHAIAAWVTDGISLAPLQAVGGWLGNHAAERRAPAATGGSQQPVLPAGRLPEG